MSRLRSTLVRLAPLLLVAIGACALPHHPSSDVVMRDGTEINIGDGTDRIDVPVPDGMDAPDAPDVADVMDVTDVPDAPDVPDVTDVPVEACTGLVCGANCIDPSTDVRNCGSCGNDCTTLMNVSAGSVRCMAGVCDLTLSCNPGFGNCDSNPANGCETSLTTPTDCGACGMVCPSGAPMCGTSSGSTVCVTGCVGATPDRCGMTCTNRTTDVNNCGVCGTVCPSGPNSTAGCTAGTCSLMCAPGFADCDGNASNGCEVNTGTDPLNCGVCRATCPSGANAAAACTGGVCGLTCTSGFGNCNTNPSDGCEANLNTDPATCGMCSTSCPSPAGSTRNCSAGVCGFTCTAGRRDCDGNAANGCESTLATDVNNCGSCGNVCRGGTGITPTCTAGVCGVTCATGYVQSGTTCVPAATENCGGTGVPVTLADHASIVLTGDLTGRGSEIRGMATGCITGSGTPDLAYTVTPSASGTLTYRLSALFNAEALVRNGCGSGMDLECTTANGSVGENEINVTAGTTYYFWVESVNGEFGTYALQLSLNSTDCGNRIIDAGENCDDGNTTAGDGCSATCGLEAGARAEACGGATGGLAIGNAPAWFTGDTRGLANDFMNSCSSSTANDAVFSFVPSVSGMMRATLYPSNWNGLVAIRSACGTMSAELDCGNAGGDQAIESASTMVTAGMRYYVIVDGGNSGTTSGVFRLSVEIPRCGDSVLEFGETCDDGNTTPGDGCDAMCASEPFCRTMEAENNPYNMPNPAASGCASNEIFASINPTSSDEDFFSISLIAGQVLTARTFVGSPTACAPGVDTVLEIYRGTLSAAPTNTQCGTGSILCNDDMIMQTDLCSEWTFPVPAGGAYTIRAYSYGHSGTIANYGIYLGVR